MTYDVGNPPFEELPRTASIQAQAVAEVRKMYEDLAACHETIGQLKADLNREKDRVTLVAEERARYRAEANAYRALLIELSTTQTNIGLMCDKATGVMKKIDEILASETPEEGVPHKTELPGFPDLNDEMARLTLKKIGDSISNAPL